LPRRLIEHTQLDSNIEFIFDSGQIAVMRGHFDLYQSLALLVCFDKGDGMRPVKEVSIMGNSLKMSKVAPLTDDVLWRFFCQSCRSGSKKDENKEDT
jgi:hypothetical protein